MKQAMWMVLIILLLFVVAVLIADYIEFQIEKHAVIDTAEAITKGEA
jgi:hypothetical protein